MVDFRAVLVLLCVFLFKDAFPFQPTFSRDPKVIIVGAGPSGLAAAARLMENGLNDITVFEAEGRLGGRVNSIFFGDNMIDLGAEWVHGQQGSIVYKLAQEHKIELKSSDFGNNVYYSTGEKLEESLANDITEFAKQADEVNDCGQGENLTGISIADYVLERYSTDILEKYKDNKRKVKIATESISLVESLINSINGCLDWNDMSLEGGYEECPGDQDLNWDGKGYRTILNLLFANVYPKLNEDLETKFDKVEKNKEVSKIMWRQLNGKVKVKCTDGTEHLADHVIFTPSLGVLKHDYRTLFTPHLSLNFRNCIKSFGYGAVMKIPLYFEEKWWDGDLKAVSFVWKAEDKINAALEFTKGPIKNGVSWITQMYAIRQAENNPNVVIAWVTGKFIPDLEVTSSETIKDGIMFVLNKFLGKEHNISEPKNLTHTTWYTNPHFRGTYSFSTLESEAMDVNCNEQLGLTQWNNHTPVLLFAGEATSRNHYSTVHGAIESGYRAADELLRYHDLQVY